MLTRRQAFVSALAAPLFGGRPHRVPEGLWPVMLTPFRADRSIDWRALDALTEWYLANGAVGLFACCQSSEVWELTEAERLEVAARVVKRAGLAPVVAGGLPGFAAGAVGEFVSRLRDGGVAAAVLTTSQVAAKPEPDSLWRERVEAILTAAPGLPFGLYEAPSPYKRLLSPEMMAWAGRTGRFVFHKDTTCELAAVVEKVRAVRGSAVGIFNAHVPILVDAIRGGGHGFSGIAANAYPHVVARAVRAARRRGAEAGRLQQFLTEGEATLSVRYPLSAKLMAGWAGVPIEPVCRRKVVELTAAQTERLRGLRTAADRLVS
ncbi:MAG: dihydrodipicolinate synthase family protein [Acidobacteriota bacterium]